MTDRICDTSHNNTVALNTSHNNTRAFITDALGKLYCVKLTELGMDASTCRNWVLKQRIKQHFGEELRFVRSSVSEPEHVDETRVSAVGRSTAHPGG